MNTLSISVPNWIVAFLGIKSRANTFTFNSEGGFGVSLISATILIVESGMKHRSKIFNRV